MGKNEWKTEGLIEFLIDLNLKGYTYDQMSREVEKVFGLYFGADSIRKKLRSLGISKNFQAENVPFQGFEVQRITGLTPFKGKIRLFYLADIHVGDRNLNLEFIRQVIDDIKSHKATYGFIGGDIINIITKDSIGNVYTQKESPDEQIEKAIELLYPIRNRILKIIGGNHEARAVKSVGIDPVGIIANRLRVPYGEYILSVIDFGDVWYSVFGLHRLTNAATKSALISRLERMSDAFICDIYLGAHSHHSIGSKDELYIVRKEGIEIVRRVYLSTISFLNYGGYAIIKPYRPSGHDFPYLELSTTEKKIRLLL